MRRALALAVLVPFALAGVACEDLPPVPEAPNVAPVASFFHNPVAPINAGETPVQFNAVASRDADGEIASYVWNFGDGTPVVTTDVPAVNHVFPDTAARCVEMTYSVLLTVVDDDGGSGYATTQVRVLELPLASSTQCR